MRDSMLHRGPDGFGSHHAAGIFLGHRRLSILDHEGGRQPMCDPTRSVWIVFNGEIYNHGEIRRHLEAKGHRFQSDHSDTEVILVAYLEWGTACVERFEGMFAFAIYDSRDHTLHIARDRLGIKPLFVWEGDGAFVFASEIKAILAYPGFEAALDHNAVPSYLSYRYVIGTASFFEGVKKLAPGTVVSVSTEQSRSNTYWSLPQPLPAGEENERDEASAREELALLLDSSVRQRMMGDVPIGAYLSGGLDSSLIAALMARHSPDAVKTFTIGFREEGFNEFEPAREVADLIQCDHHEMVLEQQDYFALMPELIRFKDEPLAVTNEVALWQMSLELKKHVTVVLSGEGADEIFAGYGRVFRSPYDLERMQALGGPASVPTALRERWTDLFTGEYGERWPTTPLELFLHHYNYVSRAERETALTPEFVRSLDPDSAPELHFASAFDEVTEASVYDQFLWVFEKLHLPGLLGRLDTATMAASVEGRVPFVDHRMVEFAMALPFGFKQRWRSEGDREAAELELAKQLSETRDVTKALLRDVAKSFLPARIIERKKMGFPVPVHSWFSGPHRDKTREILLDPGVRNQGIIDTDRVEAWLGDDSFMSQHSNGLKIWMLLNLALWQQEYL